MKYEKVIVRTKFNRFVFLDTTNEIYLFKTDNSRKAGTLMKLTKNSVINVRSLWTRYQIKKI